MTSKARNIVLTKSQAACLIALRRRKDSKTEIAIQAQLDLTKTATELRALARIGLARQNRTRKGGTRPRAGKHVASRSFRIDCGETAGSLAPVPCACFNC